MFKSRSQSGSDAPVTVPVGLTKVSALAGPPGLVPEPRSRSHSPTLNVIQPDEARLEKKDQFPSKVIKEPSHQLVKRIKLLSIEDLKAGQVAPWLVLAESLARANDP